jgi:hypothetical protein
MPKKTSTPTEADFVALLGLAAEAAEKRAGPRTTPRTTWASAPHCALQLKISLRDITPSIWRRVVVPDSYTLDDLHSVIQTAMGWMGGHMHVFRKARQGFGEQEELPQSASLQRVVQRKGQKILYEYDFGDGWLHEILVEKIVPLDTNGVYPICLDGARACPPEDCGGPPGYAHLLEAFRNPTVENEELREWAGGKFDPGAFSVDAVNQCWTGRRKRKKS